MIGIIDYGMGNLYSVSKALERMNAQYVISNQINELSKTDGLILPGVGSFKDAMEILTETGLASFIKESVNNGKPLLGICLGMQLLFEESEENGPSKGLGLLPGKVVRFSGKKYKVPHMGWNQLEFHQPSALLQNLTEGHVYFVHSYYVKTEDTSIILASSSYDVEVPAIVGKNHIFGTQFHPEKSSELGLSILKNYLGMVDNVE